MARANPYLRSLRIFDPDVDLAIDDRPIQGKQSKKASDDFMSDPLLNLTEESASSGGSADSAGTTKPDREKSDDASSKSPSHIERARQAEATHPAPDFDEEPGGKVVEL